MKRNIIAIMLTLCSIVFVGCTNVEKHAASSNTSVGEEGTYETATSQEYVESQTTEQASDTEGETEVLVGIEAAMQVPEEGLSLLQKVLLNKIEFYGETDHFDYQSDSMDKYRVEEYYSFCDYSPKSNDYFYVIDFDKDGKSEVCVKYTAAYMMIFHEENGEIYGYDVSTRTMCPLYEDGTFFCWGGVRRYYLYGNVSFENYQFSYNAITTVATEYGENPNGIQYYYKDAEPGMEASVEISKEEYNQIMSQYPREEATRYDFTIENILKYVE